MIKSWFPGHMAKAFQNIKEIEHFLDFFIIILDARCPFDSYNENLDKISPSKTRLFIINKIDLADINKMKKIKDKFNHPKDTIIFLSLKNMLAKKKIWQAINQITKIKKAKDLKKGLQKSFIKTAILGTPNVGKSTLINILLGKKIAKVENKPGVTKHQKWFKNKFLYLLDTPGILWPQISNDEILIKLFMINAIKKDLILISKLFNLSYALLSNYYPEKIIKINLKPAYNETEIYNNLISLCKTKKFFKKNKILDIDKGMNYFINYFQNIKGVTYE